jgi:ribosomal protein S18 acetylase RimI-like enzyme
MIRIAGYEAKYFEGLVALLQEWEHSSFDFSPVGVREQLARLAAHKESRIFLAVDGDERVLGYALCEQRHLLGLQPFVEIVQLLVTEHGRGHGIGSALLRHVEELYGQAGATHARLHSRTERTRAHALYERSGYKLYKTSKFYEKPLN